MNKKEIEDQFRRLCRTAGLTDYEEYINDWLSMGHRVLTTEFEIPSYKLEETILSVENQDLYCFPYVYDAMDVSIYYNGRRLDPCPEEALDLAMDRRTGNKGPVKYYDWAGIIDADLLKVTDAFVDNKSATVWAAVSAPFVAAHAGLWCRFDPFVGADGIMRNPGDFGYKIDTVVGTGQVTLAEAYRGPSSTAANPSPMRIRPKETQVFRLYGIPAEDDLDIDIKIYRCPRRLYNDEDVPEYPGLGMAIACMGISLGLEHLQRYDESAVWERRGFQYLSSFKHRRRKIDTLTPDRVRGRVIGRKTGLPSIGSRRYGGWR
jgi:hypothetical protein